MARSEGFEPSTARFVAEYSIQLSYERADESSFYSTNTIQMLASERLSSTKLLFSPVSDVACLPLMGAHYMDQSALSQP